MREEWLEAKVCHRVVQHYMKKLHKNTLTEVEEMRNAISSFEWQDQLQL